MTLVYESAWIWPKTCNMLDLRTAVTCDLFAYTCDLRKTQKKMPNEVIIMSTWDDNVLKSLLQNIQCSMSQAVGTTYCSNQKKKNICNDRLIVFATSLSGPAIDLQKRPIFQKKIISSDEAHFDLGGYVNKQNCRIWVTENPYAYIEKPTHPKRVTVWCGFWSRDIIGHFSSQMSKERPLAPFGFNRIFYALFLKIALSAAELMSFGQFGAAIWHLWTIICGVPSKISVTPISQKQLTL